MIKIDGFRVYSDVEGAKVRRLSDGLVAGMMSLMGGQTAADFAEILPDEVEALEAAAAEAKRERERARRYAALVSGYVHERYSVDDEVALLANSQSPALLADEDKAASLAAELEAYQAYRAECKERARRELENAEAADDGGKEVGS